MTMAKVPFVEIEDKMESQWPFLSIRQLLVGLSLLAIATLSGCVGVVVYVDQVEPQLQRAPLARIRPGVTTLQQMLDCLGPPLAIVRNDATPLRLPLPGAGQKQVETASADQYFLPFTQRRALEPGDTIYYYRGTYYRNFTSFFWPIFFVIGYASDYGIHEKRLWVLYNEQSGRVEDLLEEKVKVEEEPYPGPNFMMAGAH
jgi:hypothetical protein